MKNYLETNRVIVIIQGIDLQYPIFAESCDSPTRRIDSIEVPYGNSVTHLPIRKYIDDITIRIYNTTKEIEEQLYNWYSESKKRTVEIVQYNEDNVVQRTVKLFGAFPKKINLNRKDILELVLHCDSAS